MRFPRLRTLTPVVAIAAVSLLAAGCGGGGSPGVASVTSSTAPSVSGSSSTTSSAEALLRAGRCLRQHGIPNLPDPTIATSGPAKGYAVLNKQILQATPNSVVSQAMAACRASLEQARIYSGQTSTNTAQEVQYLLAFARCVRNHGVANFPDPNSDPTTQGPFNLSGTGINIDALTPAELAAARICLPKAHGAISIPPQGTSTSNSGQ